MNTGAFRMVPGEQVSMRFYRHTFADRHLTGVPEVS